MYVAVSAFEQECVVVIAVPAAAVALLFFRC